MRPGFPDAGLRVEAHGDWGVLDALKGEWETLLRASDADCLFLSWEWLSAWSRVARGRVQPLLLTARNAAGELVGVAPLYQMGYALGRLIPYRTLRVMGDYPTGAEYPDWIVRKDGADAIAGALAAGLWDRRGDWDGLWMPNVAGWTGARDRLRSACASLGMRWHERTTSFSSFALPDTMDAYLRALSKNKRSGLKRNRRAIFDGGARLVRCASRDEIPALLDALFVLNDLRWRARGDRGTFVRKPAEADFYRAFAPLAFDRGWLRIAAIEADGRLRAVQIGYVYNGVLHALQEGFDTDYASGVGNVLRAAVIEDCIAEGVRAVDFLGGYNEEKSRWLARERHGHDLWIGVPRPRNWLLFRVGFWPSGRYLRPRAWWLEPGEGR